MNGDCPARPPSESVNEAGHELRHDLAVVAPKDPPLATGGHDDDLCGLSLRLAPGHQEFVQCMGLSVIRIRQDKSFI